MGSQESLLWLAGHGVVGRAELAGTTRFVYPGSGHEDALKPYSCFGGLYICVLELAMGREELQKAESSSWSPRASFYRKGVATVAHRRWKGNSDARLSLALHDKAHLMRLA